MKNLAGKQEAGDEVKKELTRCGIEVVWDAGRREGEVPTRYVGHLDYACGRAVFSRQWYYYSCDALIPLTLAKQLYADPVGKTDIRVNGDIGCPDPEERITWRLPDGRTVLPTKAIEEWDRLDHLDFMKEKRKEYVFNDDPKGLGAKAYIDSYHVDSELGLYILANAMKNYKEDC